MRLDFASCLATVLWMGPLSLAEDKLDVKAALERSIIEPALPLREVQAYVESRVLPMPDVTNVAEWEPHANRMRRDTLDKIVFRGQAAAWRDAKVNVEWAETIDGGPGYKIKKLRYEALPGLWIPALLYEPEKLSGQVAVGLAVNGHDPLGKAAKYKQIRCINMAKRGMVVLNLEWLNMGQLKQENFAHYKMNQLDLCGTSGLAPFYLAMSKGLDVLLAHPNADPKRVAVSGLSGGGWQTIVISSLDTRVTLTNPVAGYSSIRTRARYAQDLGDSEQTPVDLATTADYAQLTALMAPRPTLLTFNGKDNCCFKAEHALPPLVEAAQPIFALYKKTNALSTHVNHDPGDHNFEKDNREAFYRMLGDHFFSGQSFDSKEIACDDEVKTAEQLQVALPAINEDFHSLALKLATTLPRDGALPTDKQRAAAWRTQKLERLREITRFKLESVQAVRETEEKTFSDGTATHWWLRVGGSWTIPAVALTRGKTIGQVLIVADGGRKTIPVELVDEWLNKGYRVIALDPFYLGESKISERDFLHALQLSCVGDRPLGVQASQISAIVRWVNREFSGGPVRLLAVGPRTSLASLVASAFEPTVEAVELCESLGSLKQVLEDNLGVNQIPEYFCFGLLEHFDVVPLAALSAPRRVTFANPSARLKTEVAPLAAWNKLHGIEHESTRSTETSVSQ
jgi:dienelactone hydrolase